MFNIDSCDLLCLDLEAAEEVRSALDPAHVAALAGLLKLVSDPTRLLIVQALGLDISVEPIRTHAPLAREYDMFRLRAAEGLTLEEIAVRHGLHRERVRQILRAHFRLGEPWSANARRKARAKARRGRGQ